MLLKKFWEIEEIKESPQISPEEASCEQPFVRGYRRDQNGRYIVKLPLKQKTLIKFGNTKQQAVRMLRKI